MKLSVDSKIRRALKSAKHYRTQCRVAILKILTKADKLSQLERARQKKGLAGTRRLKGRPLLFFSAHTGEGKDELWGLIQKAVSEDRGRGDS